MKNQTFYNREKPLFERKHVPFELIASNDHGKIGHGPKSLSKRKAFFTIRVLQGHRAIQNNAGSSEKSIRLELSDEHRKVGKQTSSFARKNVQQNPMVHVESKPMSHWQLPNHGPIHFPAMQHLPAAEFVDNNSSIEDDEVLIDSLNAINLYELEVGESDFAQLRQDQALLVDFSDFSKSFIELLLLCDLGREDGTQECKQGSDLAPQTASSLVGSCSMIPSFSTTSSGSNIGQEVKTIGSQFTCRIEDFTGQGAKSWNENKGSKNGARFSIVESNQFRELVHLSLDIRPGSDETVRSYLSARLNEVLGQNAMLKFQLGNEKHRANINEKACNDISRQYNEMLSISEKERCTLAQEAGESIQKESTMRLEELQIITRLKEDEIQSLKDKVGGQLTCLQTDLELMGNENNRLIEENQDKNKALQNLEYNLDKYESALELARSDMESLKREFQIVKSERDDMEEDFKESQIIVSKLEASNAQYESRVAEYQNESKMTSKYAQDSKHEASNYSNQLRNAQGELDTTKVELGKANELLVRYQRDRQEIKRRMKSKADLIQKQEEILASVEFRSTELQERFVDKETECGCLGKELSMAKQHLSQARQQVEENQRTLASNQQVIAWLNKEANKENKNSQGNVIGRSYSNGIPGTAPRISLASPSKYVTSEFKTPNVMYQKRISKSTTNTPNLPFMSRVLAMNTTTPHSKENVLQSHIRSESNQFEGTASVRSNGSSSVSTSIPLPRPAVPTPTPSKGLIQSRSPFLQKYTAANYPLAQNKAPTPYQ